MRKIKDDVEDGGELIIGGNDLCGTEKSSTKCEYAFERINIYVVTHAVNLDDG